MGGGVFQQAADGYVFKQPVAVFEHKPIEQSPCRPPVAVAERVDVANQEMQDDGLDNRVDKQRVFHAVISVVGKRAYRFHQRMNLPVRRRLVQAVAVVIGDKDFVVPPELPGLGLVFNGVAGGDAV